MEFTERRLPLMIYNVDMVHWNVYKLKHKLGTHFGGYYSLLQNVWSQLPPILFVQ